MLVSVLHFVTDDTVAHHAVRTLLDVLHGGSYMVLSHATNDFMPVEAADGIAAADRATRVDFDSAPVSRSPLSPTACN